MYNVTSPFIHVDHVCKCPLLYQFVGTLLTFIERSKSLKFEGEYQIFHILRVPFNFFLSPKNLEGLLSPMTNKLSGAFPAKKKLKNSNNFQNYQKRVPANRIWARKTQANSNNFKILWKGKWRLCQNLCWKFQPGTPFQFSTFLNFISIIN